MVNRLFYGDNLDVLRDHSSFPDESVDLVYLDPPFNSNRSYNVLFKSRSGADAQAQIEAFDDTWTWSQQTEHQYLELIAGGASPTVTAALVAMRGLVGENDVLAYLVMMTARLVELHRVLKPTGSLYLHCDPTASHYLKVMLDSIFGPAQFRNEIVWRRSHGHNSANRYGANHDVILFYGRTPQATWNGIFQQYDPAYLAKHYRHVDPQGRRYKHENPTGAGVRRGVTGKPWKGIDPTPKGRHWARPPDQLEQLDAAGLIYWPKKPGSWPYIKVYLDEREGIPAQDVWTDIPPINMIAKERLGYPTQKPIALLERIIQASSKPGDLVLDPFCGCGSTIDAAQRLERRWAGIDVTFLAVDLIDTRLRDVYGADIAAAYEIRGIPKDVEGAVALFQRNPFEFERWAVSQVDGTPNERQVGDRGSDGVVTFPADGRSAVGRALVSVKGGKSVNPGMVRDLVGTVNQERAELGLFISLSPPTAGMQEVARRSGDYVWGADGRRFPRIQLLTVAELLDGRRPQMPTPFRPYTKGRRLVDDRQAALF